MTGRPRVLLTGFQAPVFLRENPSQRLMEAVSPSLVPEADLRAVVLPVDYVESKRILAREVETFRPDAVLLFGVDTGADWLAIERVGLNVDYCDDPDNAGRVRNGLRIVEGGPVGYWCTAPVESVCAALKAERFRVHVSSYAGGHLCNHLLYYALHLAEAGGHGYACAFVHIPPLPEQARELGAERTGMPLERLLEATRTIVRTVLAAGAGPAAPE